MKTIKQLLEQHREEGRFSPTIPRAPKNKGIGPRKSVDSVNVKLKEDTEHPELKKIRDEYEKREGKGSFDKQTHKWSDDPHRSIWGDRLVSDYKSKKHQLELKKEDVELQESHVEFRLDHRDKVKGDHKPTFAHHDAEISDTTDKATYVKVPSHKADSFKSAMKSKHGVTAELVESIQIDEISKQTLGSYIKKASHDVATKGALTRHFAEKGQRERDADKWLDASKSNATADKIFKKSWKRREGMAKAVDKLTKEEVEQLTELSPETKTSYLQKAKSQVKELKPWTKKGEYKDLAKRMISRREKGISRFKEDSVVEEGVKSVYHNFMAKRASRKADDAYDVDDEKEFQKQVDKSEYHRVKAGGKPYKINTNRPDSKFILKKEETEQIDEMSGAGMSTRDVHKHLKKSGWQLARTKGGHDVFTHPKSKNNIAVPRHRGDLKAPTVLGIMKAAKIEEAENSMMADTSRINLYADDPSRPSVESPRKAKQVKEEIAGWVAHYNGKKHEIQKHEAKDLWNAKQKAIEHFKVPKSKHGLVAIKPGYNEETEINESRKIEIVREAIKKAKEKKEVKDKFEAEPELTSQIIK